MMRCVPSSERTRAKAGLSNSASSAVWPLRKRPRSWRFHQTACWTTGASPSPGCCGNCPAEPGPLEWLYEPSIGTDKTACGRNKLARLTTGDYLWNRSVYPRSLRLDRRACPSLRPIRKLSIPNSSRSFGEVRRNSWRLIHAMWWCHSIILRQRRCY